MFGEAGFWHRGDASSSALGGYVEVEVGIWGGLEGKGNLQPHGFGCGRLSWAGNGSAVWCARLFLILGRMWMWIVDVDVRDQSKVRTGSFLVNLFGRFRHWV